MNEYEKHCVEVLAENAFWRFAASMPNTMWKYTKKIMMFLTKYDIVNYIGFSPGMRGYNQFQLNREYFDGLEGTAIEKFMQRLSQFENILLENEDFQKYVRYMKKYENQPKYILGNKKTVEISYGKSKDLYQIIANKDFSSLTHDNVACLIKKGTTGGYVESEENLDQNGKCWIDNFSFVVDSAYITEDSIINTSTIQGNSLIKGTSFIQISEIFDNSIIEDSSLEKAIIKNNVYIAKSKICASAIQDDVEIYNNSYIFSSTLKENIWIDHSSIISSEFEGNQKIRKKIYKRNNDVTIL